jgi:hypothetical protein
VTRLPWWPRWLTRLLLPITCAAAINTGFAAHAGASLAGAVGVGAATAAVITVAWALAPPRRPAPPPDDPAQRLAHLNRLIRDSKEQP